MADSKRALDSRSEERRVGKECRYWRDWSSDVCSSDLLPLVVMMNKGSASAAEIFSGAMQDYKRAKLVGDQSFGKGTVQETHELDGGTGIHVTTAKWLTPNERWIQDRKSVV